MRYLLSISIGPVQDFVAAARKTRDLWFGSYLLSELCRDAARSLQAADAELIFPLEECVANGDAAVANKLLVVINTDSPAALAEQAKSVAKDKLMSYWNSVADKLMILED